MNHIEAVDRACEEPTLLDALSWIAVWECERVIPVAHRYLNDESRWHNTGEQGWDTCFKFLIKETMEQYAIKKLKGE